MMKRRELREHTFKLVFSALFDTCFPEESFEYYFLDNDISGADAEYIRSAVNGIVSHLGSIDEAILRNTKGYTFDRISKICLAAMRVAIYEIFYIPNDDIPGSVSISEAIEIAEKYENEKSKSFVNGILGTVLREFEKEV